MLKFEKASFDLIKNNSIIYFRSQDLPKSELVKPAIIAAAELVLHRKSDQDCCQNFMRCNLY